MNQHQAQKHKYNNILSFKYNRFIKNIYLEVRRLSRTFFAKYTPPTLKKKKKARILGNLFAYSCSRCCKKCILKKVVKQIWKTCNIVQK